MKYLLGLMLLPLLLSPAFAESPEDYEQVLPSEKVTLDLKHNLKKIIIILENKGNNNQRFIRSKEKWKMIFNKRAWRSE